MSAARQVGIHINAPCGGRGICGNCRVVFPRGAPEPVEAEEQHLSREELSAGWRLACQARIEGDAVVVVPAATGTQEGKILTEGTGRSVALAPNAAKRHIVLPEPTLEDGRADADRLLDACRAAFPDRELEERLPAALLGRLPRLLREADFQVTAVVQGSRVVGLEPGDSAGRLFGAAVDVGTTTVVGILFDLSTGRQLAVASRTNPQTALGDDVVSRIHHASAGPSGLTELRRLAVRCLNEIVGELCRRAGVKRREIYEVTVAGNTTMNHLLLGIDPTYLAQAPYVAVQRGGVYRPAREVGLRLAPGAGLYTLPNIAGFVGGDTVGVILATDLARTDGVRLAVDIGTNGEMVLAVGDRLVACSTAAGPAFEGARITCGMRALPGAIEGVRLEDGDLQLSTIDNRPPRGLCGTGLIEAVSTLLEAGVIDPTGRVRSPEEVPGLPGALRGRIVPARSGNDVVLARGVEEPRLEIRLTQRDVREMQLAKAAIAAGIHTLLAEHSLAPGDLDEVLLAGAFGSHVCVHCAARVGLLPPVPAERIRFVGNAAVEGARMVLLDASLREEAERISRSTRYLELAGRSDFQQAFSEAMLFPD